MNSDKKVVFPDEMLENRQVESTIFTPENEAFGIALLSETAGATLPADPHEEPPVTTETTVETRNSKTKSKMG
ncbi:hypothetical protein ACUL41_03580 [Virgibacillus natechei]